MFQRILLIVHFTDREFTRRFQDSA